MSPKWIFFIFQNFYQKDHVVVGFLGSTPKLARFSFLLYSPRCSHPIRLQYSLNCNFWRKSWLYVIFLLAVRHPWMLKIGHVILVSFVTHLNVPKVLRNKKSPISQEQIEWFSRFFIIHSDINGSYKLILSILLVNVRHIWAFPKCSEKAKSSNCVCCCFCMQADKHWNYKLVMLDW